MLMWAGPLEGTLSLLLWLLCLIVDLLTPLSFIFFLNGDHSHWEAHGGMISLLENISMMNDRIEALEII